MFKIGEFSRVAQVSIRLLRYYDKIDLFKPDHIDAKSGYRYYAIDQIPRLNRIIALKELGLSLEQVAQLLDDNITAQEVRGMLILKKKQLEQAIAEEENRLNRVEARLQEVEAEGKLSPYAPILKSIPNQHYLAYRETAPSEDAMSSLIFATIRAIYAKYNRFGVSAAVFYDKEFDTEAIDWSYGYLLETDEPKEMLLDDGRVLKYSILPAVEQMITVVHQGPWLYLYRGYIALGRWMSANGYQFAGSAREIFLRIAPPEEVDTTLTEIQFPVVPINDAPITP